MTAAHDCPGTSPGRTRHRPGHRHPARGRGGLTALGALRGGLIALWYAGYGLLYVALGWSVYQGRRWAQVVVLVMCAIGLLIGVARIVDRGIAGGTVGLV